MKLPNYYEDPNTLHVGTCETAATTSHTVRI